MNKLYHIIFNLIVLSAIIYIGIDIFYMSIRSELTQIHAATIVMPKIQAAEQYKMPPLDDFRIIVDRNLFASFDSGSNEAEPEEIEDLEPTSLKISLLGTVTGNRKSAYAVIEEIVKRKQGLYRVGDSIQDAVVKIILRGKVVLRVGDKDEILTMEEEESSKIFKKSYPSSKTFKEKNTLIVDRSELQNSLNDLNKLLSQIRIRPHFKDGESDGLSVANIKAGSIFSKLGLKDGDIIQGVNGQVIDGPDDVLQLYADMESESHISLELTRKGEPIIINYNIE